MMAEPIICPVCGESNPADMEFCRNCQSRLRPLTGALKGENAPIQPGDLPTKKVTSELEPLLPQWLRDARQQARDSAAEDVSKAEAEEPGTPAFSGPDLLAGLESQGGEDEEEVPEWLAHITGGSSKKRKPAPEENKVKWVELGRGDEAAEPPIDHEARTAAEDQGQKSEKEELTDWFKQAGASSETADFRLPPVPLDTGEGPTTAQESRPEAGLTSPSAGEDLSWLRNLEASASSQAQSGAAETPAIPIETPEWLKRLQGQPTPADASQPAREESLDWLQKLDTEQSAAEAPLPSEGQAPSPQPNVPDWLKQFGEETAGQSDAGEVLPGQPEPFIFDQALPDWLKPEEPAAPEEPGQPETAREELPQEEPSIPTEVPDWISSLGKTQEPSQPTAPSAPTLEEPEEPAAEELTTGTAFTDEALLGEDVDAIFASIQTPDWLTGITPGEPPVAESVPAASEEEEPIGPAELPSWVEAMRPVESAMAAAGGAEKDAPAEERGPLAGLHGVLPSMPGAAVPSSKPKAHSIKLDATEQQQAHAALLERILAAETSPIPMKSGAVLRSQRILRWALSLLLIIVIGGVVLSGTQVFPLPSGVPNDESSLAMSAVEAIPPDAPVLIIFDYQPSTIGEMEATGAPLVDHMLLLKHPHLALLSTSPTGPVLAEHFMSTALANRAYVRDQQYVNLGYLPGGLAGVYNFAQGPSAAVPLDANSRPAWQTAILEPVKRFSDFAAIIVLTDSVEAGRSWIEQTTSSRGSSQMILATSAQAGPMLLPYFDSGQVNGLISGVNGGATAEQTNAGLPGMVRRYWDAYSVGMYLAAALIVLGVLWSAVLRIRDRRAQAVG